MTERLQIEAADLKRRITNNDFEEVADDFSRNSLRIDEIKGLDSQYILKSKKS